MQADDRRYFVLESVLNSPVGELCRNNASLLASLEREVGPDISLMGVLGGTTARRASA